MPTVLGLSNEWVDETLAADHIAIGTPDYHYNVPAVKANIDHIVRKQMFASEVAEAAART